MILKKELLMELRLLMLIVKFLLLNYQLLRLLKFSLQQILQLGMPLLLGLEMEKFKKVTLFELQTLQPILTLLPGQLVTFTMVLLTYY